MLQTRINLPGIYNPANQRKEELIANFVVRLKEFHKILDTVKADKMDKPPQHFIIQGQRGSGKTTLLLRLFHAINDDEQLNTTLIPVIFDEEQYGVRTLYKFWEEIANYLEEHDEDTFSGLYDEMMKHIEEEDYEELCFDILKAKLNEKGKKLVLLIDNFGDMLDKFKKKEHQRLREVLIQCNDIRIIGASAVVLEFNYDYSHPFFEFFKVFHLEGLNNKETVELLLRLGETSQTEVVKRIIETNAGRVEALRRITGGVPRTVILLFEIFLDNEKGDAFQDLEMILDRVTPLYKHRMDDLPPQKQEIVDAIALNWDAIAVKDIAKKTRIPGKSVSAQLNDLEKNKIIRKIPTSTKNNLYQISERFFNIWYLMRNGRRRERQKVLWLVHFLESWCSREELTDRAKQHINSLKTGNLSEKFAFYMAEALARTGINMDVQGEMIITARAYLERKNSTLADELSDSTLEPLSTALFSLGINEIQEAINTLDRLIDRNESIDLKGDDSGSIVFIEMLSLIFSFFLAKKQYHYVLKLFQENKFNIMDRFKPVYYALMVLMKDQFPDEHKKMDDTMKETVAEILEQIEQDTIDLA
jgi:DNA-binding transcriptional regulator GbsR (MarR family)/GTPase SAR1 family protein